MVDIGHRRGLEKYIDRKIVEVGNFEVFINRSLSSAFSTESSDLDHDVAVCY